jgi:hypothetical protein
MTLWDNKQRAIYKAAAAERRIADERRRYDTNTTLTIICYNCSVTHSIDVQHSDQV